MTAEHEPNRDRLRGDASAADLEQIELVNLTPHAVTIVCDDVSVTIPVGGAPARVDIERGEATPIMFGSTRLPIGWSSSVGVVTGLPEPVEGVWYIVSRIVADALPHRDDLVFPDLLVRDSEGNPIGCERLCRTVPPTPS